MKSFSEEITTIPTPTLTSHQSGSAASGARAPSGQRESWPAQRGHHDGTCHVLQSKRSHTVASNNNMRGMTSPYLVVTCNELLRYELFAAPKLLISCRPSTPTNDWSPCPGLQTFLPSHTTPSSFVSCVRLQSRSSLSRAKGDLGTDRGKAKAPVRALHTGQRRCLSR